MPVRIDRPIGTGVDLGVHPTDGWTIDSIACWAPQRVLKGNMTRSRLAILLTFVLLPGGCRKPPGEPWSCQGELHRAIAAADRVVVRDGGFDGPRPADQQKVLFRIAKPAELREIYDNLQFVPDQERHRCNCCGYPGIDWYKGKQRLALTSVQHGAAIRWEGFPGDARLTEASSAWLKRWLIDHGVRDYAIE